MLSVVGYYAGARVLLSTRKEFVVKAVVHLSFFVELAEPPDWPPDSVPLELYNSGMNEFADQVADLLFQQQELVLTSQPLGFFVNAFAGTYLTWDAQHRAERRLMRFQSRQLNADRRRRAAAADQARPGGAD